ncbi:Polyribonucleotide nucleotidyltransferase [Ostreococcus tauri]|uniref:polyribonucleotide nucleotidyltransferase n=2 Tax=Ostreococcus tauri TaxID=70448 RepID=A0A090M7T3_OSTTA|nr:Polyribonucleotide nucleotidyltransferase [Ostreococcus tauri]CEG01093.1 Polyribonucleotide nucleotidyltransferase [Ostreococcus tauri]|eukprot:XP_003075160.2 Polyribonucleotide nucleotidyltransferase [Ostreococcus tauri]
MWTRCGAVVDGRTMEKVTIGRGRRLDDVFKRVVRGSSDAIGRPRRDGGGGDACARRYARSSAASLADARFPGGVAASAGASGTRPRETTFETGRLARLTDGAVMVHSGDTVALCAATASREIDKGSLVRGFAPLLVDYRERSYAKGKIPNTFTRREGAPKEREILAMRVIDRATRPLFDKNIGREVMLQCVVMASDGGEDPAVLAVNGASAALMASSIPWNGPVAAVRVAIIRDGSGEREIVVSPSDEVVESSDFTLFYAGNDSRTLMIEAQSNKSGGLEESMLADALRVAHRAVRELLPAQIELAKEMGKPKQELVPAAVTSEMKEAVYAAMKTRLLALYEEHIQDKHERGRKMAELQSEVVAELIEANPEWAESVDALGSAYFQTCSRVMRERIFDTDTRVDGRGLYDLRALDGVAGLMPIVHGSALFERGNTQALATITLGSLDDSQKLDNLTGPTSKRLILHYSFPSFSVNETGARGISRREVGHGALAEKSLLGVFPDEESFPFAVRVNTETLESNGSSSMAAVCSGSMALMDAGVPIKEHVGAISIGLIMDEDETTREVKRYKLMDDIMGLEDVLGDMDFKIAGTRTGVTGIQLDCKPMGIPLEILIEALDRASAARQKVIDVMERAVKTPKTDVKDSAPRFGRASIPGSLIGKLIGPQGSNIKALEKDTGSKVAVLNDDGDLAIFGPNKASYDAALAHIESMKNSIIEVGKTYVTTVKDVMPFGAVLITSNGDDGLLHVSEIAHERTENVADVFSVGDVVEVKCVAREGPSGKIKWSRKALLSLPRPPGREKPRFTVNKRQTSSE